MTELLFDPDYGLTQERAQELVGKHYRAAGGETAIINAVSQVPSGRWKVHYSAVTEIPGWAGMHRTGAALLYHDDVLDRHLHDKLQQEERLK